MTFSLDFRKENLALKFERYLENSKYIDCHHADIQSLAGHLSDGIKEEEKLAKKIFEWVRDEIKHSHDFKLNPVTSIASEVLRHKTGYCYAKSHLLAALLRACNIPTGLCYQRLSISGEGPPYCLHGLNAIYLNKHGWYRVDPRGNKKNVLAEFSPPKEKLAFPISEINEKDFSEIWHEPLPDVIKCLSKYQNYLEVYQNLPDVEITRN